MGPAPSPVSLSYMGPASHNGPGALSMKVEYLQGAYARSNTACCGTALHINRMSTFFSELSWQGDSFFAYISIIIEFKGILLKLKNVARAISVE